MPAVSAKQKKFMDAAAHNPEFAKKAGVSTDVAKEFSAASKGAQIGPRNRADLQGINKQKTDHGSMNLFKKGGVMKSDMKEDMKMDKAQDKAMIKKAFKEHDAQEHKGQKGTKLALKKGGMTKMAKGGMAMKETMGPSTMAKDVEAGSNKLTKFGESAVQKRGKTRGMNMGDSGPSMGIMGGGMKMAKGGSASSRADGCAIRGKTRA
jgi:hypothetical protein